MTPPQHLDIPWMSPHLAQPPARPHSARGFVDFDWDRREQTWPIPPTRPLSAEPRLPSPRECRREEREAPPADFVPCAAEKEATALPHTAPAAKPATTPARPASRAMQALQPRQVRPAPRPPAVDGWTLVGHAKDVAQPPPCKAPPRPLPPPQAGDVEAQNGAEPINCRGQRPHHHPSRAAAAAPQSTPWAALCRDLAQGRSGLARLQRLTAAGPLGDLPTTEAKAWTQMWAELERTSGKNSEMRKRALPTVFATLRAYTSEGGSVKGQLERWQFVLESLPPSQQQLGAKLLDGGAPKVVAQLPAALVAKVLAAWPADHKSPDAEALDALHTTWLQRAAGQRAVAEALVASAGPSLVRMAANPRLLQPMAKLLAQVTAPPPELSTAFLAQIARTPQFLGLDTPCLFAPSHPAFVDLHDVVTNAARKNCANLDASAVAPLVKAAQQALRSKKIAEHEKAQVGANLAETLRLWPASLLQGTWENAADLRWIGQAARLSQDVAAVYTCSLEMRLLDDQAEGYALAAEEVAVVRTFAKPAHQLRLVVAMQAHGRKTATTGEQAADLLLCANTSLRLGGSGHNHAAGEACVRLAEACAEEQQNCVVTAKLRSALADACYFVAELMEMGRDEEAATMACHLAEASVRQTTLLGRLVHRFAQLPSLRACERMTALLQLTATYQRKLATPPQPWVQQQARLLVLLLTLQTEKRVDALVAVTRTLPAALLKDQLLGTIRVVLRRHLHAPLQGGEAFMRRLRDLLLQRPDWHAMLVAESFEWLNNAERRSGPAILFEREGLLPILALLCSSGPAEKRHALAARYAARLQVERSEKLPDSTLQREAHSYAYHVHSALYPGLMAQPDAAFCNGLPGAEQHASQAAERQATYLQNLLYAQAAHDDVGFSAQAVARAALYPAQRRQELHGALLRLLLAPLKGALEGETPQNFMDHFVNGLTLLWVVQRQGDAPKDLLGEFCSGVGKILSSAEKSLAEKMAAEVLWTVEQEAKALQRAAETGEATLLRQAMAELIRQANVQPKRSVPPAVEPEKLCLLQHLARANQSRPARLLADLPLEAGALESRVVGWLGADVSLAEADGLDQDLSRSLALDAVLADPEVERCLRAEFAAEVGASPLGALLRRRLLEVTGRGEAARKENNAPHQSPTW